MSNVDRLGFGLDSYVNNKKIPLDTEEYVGASLINYAKHFKDAKIGGSQIDLGSKYYPRSEKYIEQMNRARSRSYPLKRQMEINKAYEKSRECTCNPSKRIKSFENGQTYKLCSCKSSLN